jgi:ketosteroid isomerase-like protein
MMRNGRLLATRPCAKEAVRRWMATTYTEPPKFMITNLIAEGDFVTALGNLTIKDEDGARRPITRTATFGDFATVRWLNYDLSL